MRVNTNEWFIGVWWFITPRCSEDRLIRIGLHLGPLQWVWQWVLR